MRFLISVVELVLLDTLQLLKFFGCRDVSMYLLAQCYQNTDILFYCSEVFGVRIAFLLVHELLPALPVLGFSMYALIPERTL